MIETILEKTRGHVDSAEVHLTEARAVEVTFESGAIKSAERKTLYGIGLRVIHNGRIGFSSTTDPSRIDELVEHARSASAFGKEAGFEFPGKAALTDVETHDPQVADCGPDTLAEEGHRTVEMLRGSCPKGLANITFSAAEKRVRIANTSGLDVSYRSTEFDHSVVLNVVEGDSILWIEDGGRYGTLDIRTGEYVESIQRQYRNAETIAPKISGRLPVIFTAKEMPNVIEALKLGVNGMSRIKGDSPLIGREGDPVLGNVTIVDDPFIPGAPGSRPFDGEGVVSRRNILFDRGVFTGFLYDLYTGSAADGETTANANRGALTSPSVSSSNLVMSTGESSLEDMISGCREGILLYGVVGGGQSNLIAGDFSVSVMMGFLIRNGEIAGRLVDTMISGNVYEVFGDIAASGSITKPSGQLFVPDTMFAGLTVSSG